MPLHNFEMKTGRIAGKPEGQSAAEPLTVQGKVQRLGGGATSRPVIRHSTRHGYSRDEIVQARSVTMRKRVIGPISKTVRGVGCPFFSTL